MQEGQNQFGNKYLLSPQPDGSGAGPPGCGGILDHQSINQTLFNNFPGI